MFCVKFSNLLQIHHQYDEFVINSKILHKAFCLICLPKHYAENKMNLFGLSFLLSDV